MVAEAESSISRQSQARVTRALPNAAYAASKAAVLAMTQVAAHQLGGYDINVNAICPGMTLTAMSQATMVQRAQDLGIPLEELEAQRSAQIPIGRANEPEDIADMAAFLAGPGSRNIYGPVIQRGRRPGNALNPRVEGIVP